jgi:hypothetical protein
MRQKRIVFVITIILATLFTLCACSEQNIEPEVLLPKDEITQPNEQKPGQEVDNSQTTDEEVATGRFYINEETGFGISMDIPKQYVDKINITVSEDKSEFYICHKETNWKIATVKLFPNSEHDPNNPLDDYSPMWLLNGVANNNSEFGVEINTIRKYIQQMTESIKFIEIEPRLDIEEELPNDEQIDETTPDETNSEIPTPNT